MNSKRLVNENEIKSKWIPMIKESTGIDSKSKLDWMSIYSHFHAMYENATLGNTPGMGATKFPGDPGTQYQFAGQEKGSGDKPFSLLPLSMQVAAQTIGLDLVPVVPMQGPMGILTYVDYIYAGGKLSSTERPTVFKANVGGSHTVNTTYQIEDVTALNAAVIQLEYLGVSRLDGYKLFRVGAAQTGYEAITINDIFVDGGTDYEITTEAANVVVNTVADYVKALEDHLAGFSGNNWSKDVPMDRNTGESTDYNSMGLTFFNKPVEAKTWQVAINVTREQIQDARQFGFDVMAQSNAIIANELTQSMNKNIVNRVFELGATNHQNIFTGEGVDLNLNLSGTGALTTNLGDGQDGTNVTFGSLDAFSATTGENLHTIQRRILGRILAAANLISVRGRRGAGDSAVMNAQLASALQDIAGYVPAPMNNSVAQAAGSLYPVGSVAGVNIYVDPNMGWSDTRVSVFRKGDGNTPGLVMMPYLMAESVETIAEGTMAPKIAAKSRYALVEAGHHAELNYVTFRVHTPAGGIV